MVTLYNVIHNLLLCVVVIIHGFVQKILSIRVLIDCNEVLIVFLSSHVFLF